VNRELARKVADAVLFEGYMLYPYRPSAIKNRQRWSFGILYPPDFAEVLGGTERCSMHSECLLESLGNAGVQIQLRFLHPLVRQVSQAVQLQSVKLKSLQSKDKRFQAVPSIVIDGRRIESWDEGVERCVEFDLPALEAGPQTLPFHFDGGDETELLRDSSGQLAGILTRTQHELTGTITVFCESIRDGVLKLAIEISNTTPLPNGASGDSNACGDRNSALCCSLLSAHTILTVNSASFVSLLDPPMELREAVSACRNIGNFPVLVGTPPERDMLLCSPIVLYDYPQVAPESAADFYDATEMDEMLTLRVMTLTDEEKDEMRSADDHVRTLLERTEQSAREQLSRTHGAIRMLRPVGGGKP
jgi:hydrogenase maturation protease